LTNFEILMSGTNKHKRILRRIAHAMLGVFALVLLSGAVVQPVQAPTALAAPQSDQQTDSSIKRDANFPDNPCAEQDDKGKYFSCMEKYHEPKDLDAQKNYFLWANTADRVSQVFGLDQGKGGDNHVDAVFCGNKITGHFGGSFCDGADGFQARSNTDNRLRKFTGNPYFYWSDAGDNPDAHTTQTPFGANVRFVLSEVQTRHADITGKVALQSDGVLWTFQNEYNPDIAMLYWSRGDSGAYTRLIFVNNGRCNNVEKDDPSHHLADLKPHAGDLFHDGSVEKGSDPSAGKGDKAATGPTVSKVGDKDRGILPDDPKGDDTNKRIKDYKLANNTCDETTGALAGAIRGAKKMIVDGLTGLMNTVTGWIKGVVDVGTLAQNPGVTSAWKTIRDFVNLIFILVLCVIAFSTMLRIDTERYGVRGALPKLLFSVIAVNFSFIMVQILVNVAYIVSQPFLGKALFLLQHPPSDTSIVNLDGNFGQFIVGVLVLLAVIIALFILFIFFIVRIIMIWLLISLSPFVFLFMTIPITRSLASKWWQNAIKWIFMAPISFMILFIAAEIISGGGDLAKATAYNGDIQNPSWILKLGFFVGAVIAAVMIPLKLGGEVMSKAVGGLKKGAGMTAGIGGGLAKKAGITDFREQKKAIAEQNQSGRGARLLSGYNAAKGAAINPGSLLKASRREDYKADRDAGGSRVGAATRNFGAGKKSRVQAEQNLESHEQEQAGKYASTFDEKGLESMKSALPEGSHLHGTLELALKIRKGQFQQQQQQEQSRAEVGNFEKLPDDLKRRRASQLTDRNVKETNPKLLGAIYNAKDENGNAMNLQLPSSAVRGVLEHGDESQLTELRRAHHSGKVNSSVINRLSTRDQQAYRRDIVAPGPPPPPP
jgi:hypothetical protein